MILWHSNSYLNVNIDTCKDLQGSIISGVGLFLLSSPIMYFFTAFKLPQREIGQDHNRWPRSCQGFYCMGWEKVQYWLDFIYLNCRLWLQYILCCKYTKVMAKHKIMPYVEWVLSFTPWNFIVWHIFLIPII